MDSPSYDPPQVSMYIPEVIEVIDYGLSGFSSYDQDMIIWWCRMEDEHVLWVLITLVMLFIVMLLGFG